MEFLSTNIRICFILPKSTLPPPNLGGSSRRKAEQKRAIAEYKHSQHRFGMQVP